MYIKILFIVVLCLFFFTAFSTFSQVAAKDNNIRAKIGIQVKSGDSISRAKSQARLKSGDLLRIYVHSEDNCVVYITAIQGEKLEEREIREWIKSEMPKFMWPKHFRFIDAMPQTPTYKIEKYKLKKLFLSERDSADSEKY